MPFNDTTKRLQALFAFVDQFAAGDQAMRSSFDQIIQDLVASTNALAGYLETLVSSGIDLRILGPKSATPTVRNDGSPLEAGDFYISTNAAAGRVGLMYRYDGSVFRVVSDFATVGTVGALLAGAETPAAARGVLEIGSAALQNTSAFAPASVAAEVALALRLADANGLAKTVTDWDLAHLAGPGSNFLQANAAAANGPAAVNLSAVYVAYDANNGFLIAASHNPAQIYFRVRSADAWASWVSLANVLSFAQLNLVAGDLLYATGADTLARLPKGTAGQALVMNAGETAPEWGSGSLFYRPNASFAGANVTTAQDVFDLNVTLAANTIYEFDLYFSLSKSAGTTSHTISVGFGGTAGVNNAFRYLTSSSAINPATTAANIDAHGYRVNTALATVTPGITSAAINFFYRETGTISISTAGTLIPQYQLSAAPGGAYTTNLGGFFRLRAIGAAGADVSSGVWA